MLVGVLTALGVLGAIGLLVVLFVQRGRDGIDLSLGGLLRLYLYLASLAGVIAFAIGVAGIIPAVLSAALGVDVIFVRARPNTATPFPVQGRPPGPPRPPVPSPLPSHVAAAALPAGRRALRLGRVQRALVQRALATARRTSATVA